MGDGEPLFLAAASGGFRPTTVEEYVTRTLPEPAAGSRARPRRATPTPRAPTRPPSSVTASCRQSSVRTHTSNSSLVDTVRRMAVDRSFAEERP